MKGGCGLLMGAALVLHGATARAQDLFDLQKVADGVYAAVAKPRTPINCNAAVIVYDDGVLVVDTHSRPSSARAHPADRDRDRQAGALRRQHPLPLGPCAGEPRVPGRVPAAGGDRGVRGDARESARDRDEAREGPDRRGTRPDRGAQEADRRRGGDRGRGLAPGRARQQEEYLAEIRSLELKLPDLTFDKSLILHRPDRDIMLLFLGRGHTSGDVVAYLPKQKVVATGDLLHGWMPFMGDAFPTEWVATLDALDKLDFDHIVGGHGAVKPRAHLRFFRNYIADLIEEVGRRATAARRWNKRRVRRRRRWQPKYEAGMDGRFAGSVGANIEKVYKDMAAGLY